MVRKFLVTLILIPNSWAVDGVIAVLEAPVFGEPNEASKVIQYYRKGEEVYIHPQETEEDPFRDRNFKEKDYIKADQFKDPLLENPYRPDEESKFYKTLAKSGREAWILKEHVLLDYNDAREIGQKTAKFDHTDYRIDEPLEKGYPFIFEKAYKGNFSMALGRANFDAYPYKERILDQSFNLSAEISFAWMKSQEIDPSKRFYFGGIGGIHMSSQDFVMEDQNATQTNFRLFLGPIASYDIYRNEKNTLNLSISTQLYLLDNMDVSIDGDEFDSEIRTYQSNFGVSPQFAAAYKIKNYFEKLDLSFGFNMRVNLPKTYETKDSGELDLYWRRTGSGDSYYQGFTSEITYFISFDNTY